MTELEHLFAGKLGELLNVDIVRIIEAARSGDRDAQTVGTNPSVVVTGTPDVSQPKARSRKAAEAAPVSAPPAQEPKPETAAQEKAQPAAEPAKEEAKLETQASGLNLTGLFTGSGTSKTVVKEVFFEAVERAGTLKALLALHDVCECGLPNIEAYTEETIALLKKRMVKWGNAQ